jgi:CDP-glycerol glycerophosphotransferase
MALLSVVVPIYNVEQYLEPCLESIAAQTFTDLEVVLVNDGSTDSSAEIAAAFTERDPRFRLVHRPNGGLSAARNTGIAHATGDYLAFVDSDDLLPRNAYELLMSALQQTGSDFATGKVLRLTGAGTGRAHFLSGTFSETRLRTHITSFRPLLADRIAWNKVFRREFWDAHGLEFPEGRINEDIPVILPLHFSASAVDVISEPVYYWRSRELGELSITERRAEKRALLMRIMAVSDVHDFLARNGPRNAKRWYDESLVADDLKYYLNVLDRADDEYRDLFLEKVNALLDRADDGIYDPLPAIERLKWHLVRRRRMPELLEVLRFQREELAQTPPVRVGRHWLGDYPFRTDPQLKIPNSVYRVDSELTMDAHIDALRLDEGRLRIEGWVYIDGIGAADPGAQRVSAWLLRPGRLRRLRYLVAAVRLKVEGVHRADANGQAAQRLADVSGSGFSATLDPRKLRRAGRWTDGTWELYLSVKAGGVRRIRKVFTVDELRLPTAVELPAGPGVFVRAAPTAAREIAIEVATRWAALRSARATDGELQLTIERHGYEHDGLQLELREAGGKRKRRYPLGSGDTVSVPLADVTELARLLDQDPDENALVDPSCELHLIGGGQRARVALPQDVAEGALAGLAGGREAALARTPGGDAALVVRAARAELSSARWEDGSLVLTGTRLPDGAAELALFARDRLTQHTFELTREGERGFRCIATPAAIPSLGGALPLPQGRWNLCVREQGQTDPAALVAMTVGHDLAGQLPLAAEVAGKGFTLAENAQGDAVLVVERDLALDERGPFNQDILQRTAYAARRGEPLLDAVVFASFRGRQYSDSPRAIHEELVRRDASVEHFWVVRDGACLVPETAQVLREGSREYHELLARARFVVSNDHFPDWFERREDQICVQTWHGTPLKKLGFDVSALRGSTRKFERAWETQRRNWQYVVSPNRFSTPILRRAYELEYSEMLETGYPRVDVLAGEHRDEQSRALRRRLGLPDGVRTVLYAPTFRDHVRDKRGRYRIDLQLDLERLRSALGSDTVLLFRKHHYIVDQVPETADGFVRDVSSYPDGTELLLAADVLLTDYSSMTVDFANTQRPMLFFTYDLAAYADQIRGFYIDFEATVPGPLLATTDQVIEALRDLDAVQADYAQRYDEFARTFCELDDGRAAARVVDRLFTDALPPGGGR